MRGNADERKPTMDKRSKGDEGKYDERWQTMIKGFKGDEGKC